MHRVVRVKMFIISSKNWTSFIFTSLCDVAKGFMKAFKVYWGFHKIFWDITKKSENNNLS